MSNQADVVGGAIYNKGKLNVHDSVFEENAATMVRATYNLSIALSEICALCTLLGVYHSPILLYFQFSLPNLYQMDNREEPSRAVSTMVPLYH